MLQRRYTPPTCTLEILAEDSPLSRWSAQPVLNQLRFELSFDDPRQPEDNQVKIWGDRAKLEALHEAVRSYVQDFLRRTPEYFPIGKATVPAKLDERNGGIETAPNSNIYPGDRTTLEADFTNSSNSKLSLKPFSKSADLEDEFKQHQDINKQTQLSKVGTLKPYLQPKGLLAHDLFLGPLATENSGPVVSLSALQLFDLATALDEYAADVMLLPTPKRATRIQALPPWSRAAALVVVTVGVAFAAYKGLEQQNQLATTANKAAQDSANIASAPQEVVPPPPGQQGVMNPNPQAPAIAQVSPLPMPNANTTVLAPTAPNKLLPPPPPVGALQRPPMMGQMGQPVPSANSIPNNADPIFTTRLPAPPANRPNLSVNKEPNFQVRQANLPPSLSSLPPLASSRPQASAPAKNPFRIVELPSAPTLPRTDKSALARSPQPTVARKPQAVPQPQAAPQLQTAPLPKLSASPIDPDTLASNPDPVTNQTVTNLPSTLDLPAPGVNTSRDTAASSVEQERTLIVPTKPVETAQRQSVASEPLQATRRSTADEVSKGTTFDIIPQVAQARNFLQKRWKAPESLTQPVEYYLFVNGDGSIERIIPLGQAAATYIDRTNIPLPGEQFVSPIDGGRTAKLRAVFNKNGNVQTFLEETN